MLLSPNGILVLTLILIFITMGIGKLLKALGTEPRQRNYQDISDQHLFHAWEHMETSRIMLTNLPSTQQNKERIQYIEHYQNRIHLLLLNTEEETKEEPSLPIHNN